MKNQLKSQGSKVVRMSKVRSNHKCYYCSSDINKGDSVIIESQKINKTLIKNIYCLNCSEISYKKKEVTNMNEYKCQVCGKFITEDEGITTLNGLWVCDNDTCRTLDEDNQAIENIQRV